MKPYYQDGGICIYHGDCREVLPTLEASSSIIADPPYGIAFDFSKKRSRKSGLAWGVNGREKETDREWNNVIGDDAPFDPSHLLRFNQIILWGGNHYASKLPSSKCWLVWDKKANTPSDNHSDCELAWTNLNGVVRRFTHLWRGIVRAGDENVSNGPKLHPCQKPVTLMLWCVGMTTGDIIDPYTGSGSTLVAARMVGRKAIGIELEEKYCEIAAARLSQGVLGLEFGA